MPPRNPLTLTLTLAFAPLAFAADPAGITFSKQQIDTFFTAEGGTIADFNGDGKMDVAAGPRIYAGPDFKKETARVYRSPYAFDRLAYSNNFLTYSDDFNGDGRPDILVIGWPGKEAFWFENPGPGKPGDWPQHLAYFNVDTESPGFADIDGDGRKDIIAGSGGRLGYMTRDPKNPKAAWTFHAVTPPGKYQRYTHGIGVGDINGDGRPDLLEAAGWWEQPASLAGDPVWKFHPQVFGPGGAQMYVYDVNGDGKPDVITSLAAHGYGLSWFEQGRDAAGAITFTEHAITSAKPDEKINGVQFSQPHAVMLADIDGDGLLDIVTGKRHWAHGDKGDPEPNGPAVLYWFRLSRGAGGSVTYTPHLIDSDSGVGCQFPVGDLNGDGKPDLAIVNKRGAFVFLQK
jgi:hypothetical protein